jgi:hypothetical protein
MLVIDILPIVEAISAAASRASKPGLSRWLMQLITITITKEIREMRAMSIHHFLGLLFEGQYILYTLRSKKNKQV